MFGANQFAQSYYGQNFTQHFAEDERSARLVGQDTATSSRLAVTTGTTGVTGSRSAHLTGEATTSSQRSAHTVGEDTANSSRAAHLTGTATTNSSRAAHLTGQSTATDSRSAVTTGAGGMTSTRAAHLIGTDTTESSRSAKTTGGITVASNRGAKLTGTATTVYSKEILASLPTNADDLATTYTSQEVDNVAANDEVYTDLSTTATGYLVHMFSKQHANNSEAIVLSFNLKSTLAPSDSTVYLQIYNFTSAAWVTVDSDNTAASNTDFTLSGTITADISDYYNGSNTVKARIYQQLT